MSEWLSLGFFLGTAVLGAAKRLELHVDVEHLNVGSPPSSFKHPNSRHTLMPERDQDVASCPFSRRYSGTPLAGPKAP